MKKKVGRNFTLSVYLARRSYLLLKKARGAIKDNEARRPYLLLKKARGAIKDNEARRPYLLLKKARGAIKDNEARRPYLLLKKARGAIKDNEAINFVFADINSSLGVKLIDGSFKYFNND